MRRTAITLAALLLVGAASPPQSATKLPPVDQCSNEPAFKSFHEALKQAVLSRDGEALLRLLAPDVLVNFGGESGRDAFARQWDLRAGSPHELWEEFDAILKLGCARWNESRIIPSLAGQFDESDEDVFDKMVVISPAAELRAEPNLASPVVVSLSWDVVTGLERRHEKDWVKVRLADGREGWIAGRQLRSPLDYRAAIEKRAGRWMITAFVAGD